MSALQRLSFATIAAVASCLIAGNLVAQQGSQNPGDIKPSQYRKDVTNANAPGQTDRSATTQRDQSATEENSDASNASRQQSSAQRYTAGFRGTQQRTAGDTNKAVERHLAGCLLTHNKAEIAISEFAQGKAQNAEVKKFAQQMVQDHQQMAQRLQQVAGKHGTTQRGSREYERERESTSTTTRLPGSPGADNTVTRTDDSAGTDVNVNVNRDARETEIEGTAASGSEAGHGVLMQLASIEKQITDRCTQAAKQELGQKSGAEFDECFIGAQVKGHMEMLAALEVIGQETQGELRQVAEEAKPKVQEHLDKAKQLAQQLKAGSAAGSQAERRPTSTQR
jgi:predicted outer membrane protein